MGQNALVKKSDSNGRDPQVERLVRTCYDTLIWVMGLNMGLSEEQIGSPDLNLEVLRLKK